MVSVSLSGLIILIVTICTYAHTHQSEHAHAATIHTHAHAHHSEHAHVLILATIHSTHTHAHIILSMPIYIHWGLAGGVQKFVTSLELNSIRSSILMLIVFNVSGLAINTFR